MQNNIFYQINPTTHAMRAVLNCGSSKEIKLKSSVKKGDVNYDVEEIADRAFSNLSSIDSIEFPENLKKIGIAAFSGQNISKVKIPDSVVSIGKEAFADNPLVYIVLGKNIKSIGDCAFYNYDEDNLITVINKALIPININDKVFCDTDLSKSTLQVPFSAIEVYKNAPIWNRFGKITSIQTNEKKADSPRSRQIKKSLNIDL